MINVNCDYCKRKATFKQMLKDEDIFVCDEHKYKLESLKKNDEQGKIKKFVGHFRGV